MGRAVRSIGNAVGNVARNPAALLNPTAIIGTVAAGQVAKEAGTAITGGLPKATTGDPESFAQAIRSEPFNIEARTKESKEGAQAQQAAAQGRQAQAQTEGTDLRQRLAAQARGEGPSLATAQMRQAQDRSLAQQLAAAASQRGGSPAALQRQLAMQQAQSGQQIAQDSAVVRMQEQQAAQQQLGGMIQSEQAAADQAVNNYLRLGLDIETARAAAEQDLERLRANARAGQASNQLQASIANQQQQSQLLGGLLGGASSIGAAALMSDKSKKKRIKDGTASTKDFLNALKAKEYDYKADSGEAPGRNFGIMAQDLEKSKMGKSLVLDTPNGKMVDTRRGFGAVLAGMAELNKRTAEIEKAFKKKKMPLKKES